MVGVAEIERKGKRMEKKNVRDSKCNIVEMKNILVRKFYNNFHVGLTFLMFRKVSELVKVV